MKKFLKTFLLTITAFAMIFNLCPVTAKADIMDSDPSIITEINGVMLTKDEYDNLSRVFDDDDLLSLSAEAIEAYKDEELIADTKTIFVASDEDTNNGISLTSTSDWSNTHTTTYKKITLKFIETYTGASVKTVSLTTEWLNMPNVRSYDVMAIRVTKPSVTVSTLRDSNINWTEKVDGIVTTHTYSSTSKYFNKCDEGIGLSVKLPESASKSLKYTMTVSFYSSYDPFEVYGSYQHATSSITLADSKKYDINKAGMGKVIDFKSSVSSIYDNTGGVYVRYSLDDI